MIEVQEEKNTYLADFLQRETIGTVGPSWLSPIRKAGIARFDELGFPTTDHEEWRFTSLAGLAGTEFKLASAHGAAASLAQLDGLACGETCRLVFVNGRFAPALSTHAGLPAGARTGSLATASDDETDLIRRHLARYASCRDHAFTALNTAFLSDGAFLHIPKGTIVETPVHILFLSVPGAEPTVSHPRCLILADADSQATIIETYAGLEGVPYFTNAVTELVARENAVIDHYKDQQESEQAFHIATLHLHQHRGSNVSSHSIALGGALVRNDINAVLDGEGCECILNGLYVVGGRQHVDNHLRVEHVKPHCASREYFKGILDDHASGVFSGRIVVRPDAQKTDAKQTNRNLLLGQDARIDTKPQLEIFADDVKCTHGATIGQIDRDALFYLRSRGLGEEAARGLLIHAFAAESLDRIKVAPLRRRIEEQLFTRLPQGDLLREAV